MLKNLLKVTPEEIEKSAEEATFGTIIAMESHMEVYADKLSALHYGEEVAIDDEEDE